MKNKQKLIIKKASKKILPGLGGLKNNYIKKPSCLKKTLLFLAEKLNDLKNSNNINLDEKLLIIKIKEDLVKLSGFTSKKAIDYYLDCLSIIKRY